MGLIYATFIATFLTWAELTSVLAFVFLFIYFKCKFGNEVVLSRAVRTVDITMAVWTVSRIFQGWSDINYERQAIGLILCVQQIPTGINEQYLAYLIILV